MKNKIFDCVTFFQENFITNFRFEILDKTVDYFVVCESKYDHRGNSKELNFKLANPKFKKKLSSKYRLPHTSMTWNKPFDLVTNNTTGTMNDMRQ